MTSDKGILIRNIYYMLTYAFKALRQNNYEDVDSENFEDIYDLFAEILARGISYQLKQGLHKEYVLQEDDLTTLRGKLNFKESVKLKIRQQQRLACEYDEYLENNLFNQVLKSTTLLLIRQKKVDVKRKDRLRKLMLFFSNVDEVDLRRVKWNAFQFDRNSRNYQLLLNICYFVVKDLLLTTESGRYRVLAFSEEDMALLFERFVLEYYRKEHPKLNADAPRVDWNLKKNQKSKRLMPSMKTDIVLDMGERKLIIDTKYYGHILQERFGKVEVRSQHCYQVFSYMMNFDRKRSGKVDGMLLYAKTEGDEALNSMERFVFGNRFFIRTLDLNLEFEKIKKQLDEVAEWYDNGKIFLDN